MMVWKQKFYYSLQSKWSLSLSRMNSARNYHGFFLPVYENMLKVLCLYSNVKIWIICIILYWVSLRSLIVFSSRHNSFSECLPLGFFLCLPRPLFFNNCHELLNLLFYISLCKLIHVCLYHKPISDISLMKYLNHLVVIHI